MKHVALSPEDAANLLPQKHIDPPGTGIVPGQPGQPGFAGGDPGGMTALHVEGMPQSLSVAFATPGDPATQEPTVVRRPSKGGTFRGVQPQLPTKKAVAHASPVVQARRPTLAELESEELEKAEREMMAVVRQGQDQKRRLDLIIMN